MRRIHFNGCHIGSHTSGSRPYFMPVTSLGMAVMGQVEKMIDKPHLVDKDSVLEEIFKLIGEGKTKNDIEGCRECRDILKDIEEWVILTPEQKKLLHHHLDLLLAVCDLISDMQEKNLEFKAEQEKENQKEWERFQEDRKKEEDQDHLKEDDDKKNEYKKSILQMEDWKKTQKNPDLEKHWMIQRARLNDS